MGQDNSPPEDGLVHDEVEIEDFNFDPETETFTYPCPCGDEFSVTKEELFDGQKYARCPSCSLMVMVVFNMDDLESIIEVKSARKSNQTKLSETNTKLLTG